MKDTLKNAYKETPERFRYAVRSAVVEARHSAPVKKRLSRPVRILIAAALILALVPAAVFGAAKIIGLIAEPVGSYGVALSVESQDTTDCPKYVKMHVKVPEGFAEVPNTDGRKYYNLSTAEPYTDGFSIDPFRPSSDIPAAIATFADDFEQTAVNGHTAYKIISADNYCAEFERIYVYYEDVNVVLLVYYKDVTDQQLTDFISGISFTEGTAADHTDIGTPDNNEKDESEIEQEYQFDNDYIEKPLNTEFTYGEYNEDFTEITDPSIRAKVTSVRVLDSISGLDKNSFNDLYPLNEICDDNGKILPHTREVISYGDGINTKDELISSEEVDQVLILIDISYSNLTENEKTFYIPWRLSAMIKDAEGNFSQAEVIDDTNKKVIATEYCSSEIFYLSPHGEGKAFYAPTLSAGETRIVTVGFLADKDKLDELYLNCCPFSDGVYSPSYPTENPYTYFLMKVQ